MKTRQCPNPLPDYTVDLLAAARRVLCGADAPSLEALNRAVIAFEAGMPLTETGEIFTESVVRPFKPREGVE